jgi:hypothetical protein
LPLKPNPEALAEQLFLLTLATEQAIGREDWNEANALFDRRDDILARLEALQLTPSARKRLNDVGSLEKAFATRLREWRRSLLDQICAERKERNAASAYGGATRQPFFESAG